MPSVPHKHVHGSSILSPTAFQNQLEIKIVASVEERWKIPSPLAVTVIGVLLAGAMSFNAWAVASMYERPTKVEVRDMIVQTGPFSKERSLIFEVLNQIRTSNNELKKSLDVCAREIADLRAQLKNL